MSLETSGFCISTQETVAYFEQYRDLTAAEQRRSENQLRYDRALNRLRWLARRVTPAPVKVYNPYGRRADYCCGACGAGVQAHHKFCPNCGREIDWHHRWGDVRVQGKVQKIRKEDAISV